MQSAVRVLNQDGNHAAFGKILKQEGTCDKRVTAASTFKIAISLMGYDAGFQVDEHTPALPFRDGYLDWNSSWRATTDPAGTRRVARSNRMG